MTILFFGSFKHYSVSVLDKLHKNFDVVGVVTTPPAPAGRHLELVSTEVQVYSEAENIPVFTPQILNEDSLKLLPPAPDFLVVAGYGKFIPQTWIDYPKVMAVNLHPSLLPQYRGRFPAEWAILRGETETGVSLLRITPEFDKGDILAQFKVPLESTDTKNTLYQKLFAAGGDLLVEVLPKIAANQITPRPQKPGTFFYARQLTREDGFVPWDTFETTLKEMQAGQSDSPQREPPQPNRGRSSRTAMTSAESLDRMFRALHPWPGIWSTDPTGRRIKLVSLDPLQIQYEGKKPEPFRL